MKSGNTITARHLFNFDGYPCYGGNGLRGFARTFTHDGDHVLIGRQGALCGNVKLVHGKFYASEHAIVVTANQGADIRWLYYVLDSMNLNQYSESSAQPGLSVQKLLSLSVLVPESQSEQAAIATALSDADALITALKKLIEKKRAIRAGMIQKLLSPKDGWVKRKLLECLVRMPEYGINAPAVPYSDDLPTYLRITDISPSGRFISETKASVEHPSWHHYALEEGDLVFARTGASVGKTYLYDSRDGELVFAGFLIRVKCDTRLLQPQYLKIYTETAEYWNWVRAMSTRSGQPGINGTEYAQLVLRIPPVEQQAHIAELIKSLDDEILALEKKGTKLKMIKQGMMQQLLTGRTRLKI